MRLEPHARRALQHFSTLSPSGFACQHVSKKQKADWLTSERRRLERAEVLTSAGRGRVLPQPAISGRCSCRLRPSVALPAPATRPPPRCAAVLLSLVCTHVPAPESRRPVEQVGIMDGKFGGAFDQDEVEGWFFLLDAKANAGIPEHVATLDRALSGREYQGIAVQVEPDRGHVGPAVGTYGG